MDFFVLLAKAILAADYDENHYNHHHQQHENNQKEVHPPLSLNESKQKQR